jgi:hypothetical protein
LYSSSIVEFVWLVTVAKLQKLPAGQSWAGVMPAFIWQTQPGLHLIGYNMAEKKQKVPSGQSSHYELFMLS